MEAYFQITKLIKIFFKIGYQQSLLGQLKGPQNGPEKYIKIYSATTMFGNSIN